jgi:glycosyltransferase involved in cell wall biosynthesis
VSHYGLVLDIQGSQSVHHGDRGIARFVIEHARTLLGVPGLVRGLMLNPLLPFPGHLPTDLLGSPLLSWGTATSFRRSEQAGPVAYHVMSPFELQLAAIETIVPPHALRPDVPLIVTLYDLIPLIMPERYLASDHDLARRYRARLELVRSADLVLAISEHTRRDGIRLLGLAAEKVVAIGGGVSPYFRLPVPGEDPSALIRSTLPRITRPFVLSVLGGDDRKNTEALLTAFSRLPSKLRSAHQLVIACGLSLGFAQRWNEHARDLGLTEDELIFTDRVPDDVLRALYQSARLFVFPSLYEGFGLPVVEAIACGCPSVVSATSSLPEILEWEPATFDPGDPSSIAASIERALSDPVFAWQLREVARRRAPVHTWAAVAERTAVALRHVPPSRGRNALCHRRPRVALVGPMPPSRSGIADYNARLVDELATRSELDVLLSFGEIAKLSRRAPGVRYMPLSALGRILNPASYDAIIYTIGNNHHHHETYEVARRYPGIVWFHDVRLGGLYLTYGADRHPGGPQEFVTAKLREMYGERAPSQLFGAFDFPRAAQHGIGLTRELVSASRGAFVNSAYAERLLRLDQGPDRHLSLVWRVPFAVPEPLPPSNVEPDDPPIIASFGLVEPAKMPEHLMVALSLVQARTAARLVFIGSIPGVILDDLRAKARSLGLEASVEFTESVPDAEYKRWLRRVTCAAQLRLLSHGENSSAIGDCLRAGIPVVTNMIGARDEYPENAIIPLDPSASVHDLASELTSLVTDPARRLVHREAALQHARHSTFAILAERVVEAVQELVRTDRQTAAPGGNRPVQLHALDVHESEPSLRALYCGAVPEPSVRTLR